jgi:N-methylhydantoinase A/oxoprolinase/acetone carboxylase beta subunit
MPLTIGIDVGGTNTDAVLVSSEGVLKKAKIPTDTDNLLNSILKSLDKVYDCSSSEELQRICLSTTLTTNSIVQNKYNKVGILAMPGPGLPAKYLPFNSNLQILTGYVDHRGEIVQDISIHALKKSVEKFLENDIKNIAVVGKFSNRNPALEKKAAEIINESYTEIEHISMGHRVTSRLNFPRRLATTYLNAAVFSKHKFFVKEVKEALRQKNITAPVFLLKADGGTIGLDDSLEMCVHTIMSGPAASIMGNITLTGEHLSAALIDIGGTTTDIAIMLNGSPVFEPAGAEIADSLTSIRALFSRSIGVGGDSTVETENNKLIIGPHRNGPAVVFGGSTLTPTDAAAYLGYIESCDIKAAEIALKTTAKSLNLSVEKTAHLILDKCAELIADKIKNICHKISSRPVYTVKEVLEPLIVSVDEVIGMGGPAAVLTPIIAKKLNIDYSIAPVSQVANAVGAAAARPTTSATVHCDTALGYYNVAELGLRKKIKNKDWDIDKTINTAKKSVELRAKKRSGYENIDFSKEVEITSQEEFNIVRDFQLVGKIMEVKAQIKPGPVFSLTHWKEGKNND